MADPFEVRIKFSNQLERLNATSTSATKAATYVLRHRDLHEDLHSCIIENVEKNNMNNRANIMYFLESLCDMAHREGHEDVIKSIQRDMLRIINAVAPADGSGAANVKVVRRVVSGLGQKQFLSTSTVTDLEQCLKERDVGPSHPALSPGHEEEEKQTSPTTVTHRGTGTGRLDKRQIEQRIEEDRERHKRLREHIWAVSAEENAETDKLWDDASEAGDDDYNAGQEDKLERQRVSEITVD